MQLHLFCLEKGFQFLQSPFKFFGHRVGVGPKLALHHHEHARLTVDRGGADRRRRALDHARDVADAHGTAFAIGEKFARHIGRRLWLGVGLHQNVLVGRFHETGAGHAGRLSGGRDHIFERESVAAQLFRIGLDLPLAHVAAEHVHFGDTFHGQQVRADGPVHQGAQFHRAALVRSYANAEHRAGRGCQRRNRRYDASGQQVGKRRKALRGDLAIAIHIRTVRKEDVHDRQSGYGLRAQALQSRQTGERILDGLRDLGFDEFCRQPRRLRLDHHLGGRELRKDIEVRPRQREQAVRDDGHRQRDDHAGITDGLADDEGDHLTPRPLQ